MSGLPLSSQRKPRAASVATIARILAAVSAQINTVQDPIKDWQRRYGPESDYKSNRFGLEQIGKSLYPDVRKSKDVTIYVRGFCSEGFGFDRWRDPHARMVSQHEWGGLAYGYSWPSAHVGYTALRALGAVSTNKAAGIGKTAFALGGKLAGRAVLPVTLLHTLRKEFHEARIRASEQIMPLRALLLTLKSRYAYVRVVAHSLGALHVLASLAACGGADAVDELHLCGAAVSPPEWDELFPGCVITPTVCVYYCHNDWVLRLPYRLAGGGPAIGQVGLAEAQSRGEPIFSRPTSSLSGFYNHWVYADQLHKLAPIVDRELCG